ncbi:hypothetical protein V1506DRAFT_531990 [Lipomyces tetrasporus]
MLPSASAPLPAQQSARSPSKLARRSATVPSAPVTLRAPDQPSSQNMMRSLSSVHLPPPPLTSIAVNIAQSRPLSAGQNASQNASSSSFSSSISPVKRQTSTAAHSSIGTRQLSTTAAAAQHIFSSPTLATLAASTYNAASSSSKENVSPDAPNPSSEIPPPYLMPPVHDDGEKPPFSYATLIGMAILRAPNRRLTLSQIYKWINDTFAWYRKCDAGWQNSIRHNLSLNKAFSKQERPKDDPGKGNYWIVEPGCEYLFMKGRPRKSNSGNNGNQRVSSTPATSRSGDGPDASSSPTLTKVTSSKPTEQVSRGSATPSPLQLSQELPGLMALPSNESIRRSHKRAPASVVDDMPWSSPEILVKRARDDKSIRNDASHCDFATPLRPASRAPVSSTISTTSQAVPGLSFTASSSPASMVPLTPVNSVSHPSLLPASSFIKKKANTTASRRKCSNAVSMVTQQNQAVSIYAQMPAPSDPMVSTFPLSVDSKTTHYSSADTDEDDDDEYGDNRSNPDYHDVSAGSVYPGENASESADPSTKSNRVETRLFNSSVPHLQPDQDDDTTYYFIGSSPNREHGQLHLHHTLVQQSPPRPHSALDGLAHSFSPLREQTGVTQVSSPFGSPIYIRQHQQFLSPQRKLLAQSLQFDDSGTSTTSGSGPILLTDEDDEISRACFGSPDKRSKMERTQLYFDDFWPLESSIERRGNGVVNKRTGDGSVANVFGVDVCQVVKRAMMINRQKLEMHEAGQAETVDPSEDGSRRVIAEEADESDVRPQPLFRNMTF